MSGNLTKSGTRWRGAAPDCGQPGSGQADVGLIPATAPMVPRSSLWRSADARRERSLRCCSRRARCDHLTREIS